MHIKFNSLPSFKVLYLKTTYGGVFISYNCSSDHSIFSHESLQKYVLPHYKIKHCEIIDIKFKDTEKQRAVYKINTDSLSYCLKKVYLKENDLLFVYSAMEWLYLNGIKLPKILPTINKGRFVNCENMLFILTPWINGEKLDYDNKDDLSFSIKNLAKLHKTSRNFIPIQGSKINSSSVSIYNSINKHFNYLLSFYNKAALLQDKFSKLFLDNFQCNLMLGKLALEISATINTNNLQKSLCHMDYVNKNIIVENNLSQWIIDFDKCAINYSMHDMSYFLRRYMKREKSLWSLSLLDFCIKCYKEINPINIDEYKYLISYLAFPQRYFKTSRDYFQRKNNEDMLYPLLLKSCEHSKEQLEFSKEVIEHLKLNK